MVKVATAEFFNKIGGEQTLMSGGATLRTIHSVAAIPIVVLGSLSIIAAYALGDNTRIPMHWNTNWEPNMYASKLIGLSIIPVFSFIAILPFLTSSHKKTEIKRIRDIIIIGLILLTCHIFHLYLVKQWLATLST